MGNGGEFELSQEVLAVLPSDPYEQLDVARRITAMAVATRMSKLEFETGKLRQKLTEKEHVIHGLQERVSEAEATLEEANGKISESMEEQISVGEALVRIILKSILSETITSNNNNTGSFSSPSADLKVDLEKEHLKQEPFKHETKLINEKNALAQQVKKLLRDVAKLETFKRTLMASLQEEDDNPPPNSALWKASQAESTLTKAQIFEDDGLSAKASLLADMPKIEKHQDERKSKSAGRATPPKPDSARTSPKEMIRGSTRGTPSMTPRLTPTGSPKPESKIGLPMTSMIQIPSSQPTSRSSSPPSQGSGQSRTTRLDGKEFFRQARSRLSYEQFSSFLANIKELNAHRQTREETLGKAEDIFGPENRDLYIAFEGILSRHLPS